MLIIRVLNQLEFSEIYLDLVIMVLVVPQKEISKLFKTNNLEIFLFSKLTILVTFWSHFLWGQRIFTVGECID